MSNHSLWVLSILVLIGLNSPIFADAVAKTHNPSELIKQWENDPNGGSKVYEAYCKICHSEHPQIPLNAPRIHNVKDWQSRRLKGIDGLVKIAALGLNNMPPRGGCFECSDELLKKAILYMLPQENTKK